MTRTDRLLALFVPTIWGANFAVIRIGLHHVPPLRLAALRFLLTRAYDWINTPPDAMVTRKDPLAYLRRLDFYADATPADLGAA